MKRTMSNRTQEMLADIEQEVLHTRNLIGRDALDPRVMRAMAEVPRHEFVPGSEQGFAYANGPLPIGHGQSISQPYMVALMTDLLGCGSQDRVLEIGTGSGYQTAVLSRLVQRVYSLEILPALAEQAADRLSRLGYTNLETRQGDGYDGWPEAAPFDGIMVTAAATRIPPPLVEQLREGARLVIPVGPPSGFQQLMTLHKALDGSTSTREVLGVAFVPLTRGAGAR